MRAISYFVYDDGHGSYDGYATALLSHTPTMRHLLTDGFRITTKVEYQTAKTICDCKHSDQQEESEV